MVSRRIIACLDVAGGKVVKGVRFGAHRVMGDIVPLALRHRDAGADELVLYDIGASPGSRTVDAGWIERVAREIDIPFCVAGGIRSVDDARRALHAGADKISVNSPALERPALIGELAEAFGSQCVVVGVDSLLDADGDWHVRRNSGDPARTFALVTGTLDWIAEAQSRGAGEIVLNCMGSDGTREGYDLKLIKAVAAATEVPVIASGGAGELNHFAQAVEAGAAAVAAGSLFVHHGKHRAVLISYPERSALEARLP